MYRDCIICATENVNTPPRRSDVEKLIQKAWLKPAKIFKFYKHIMERDIQSFTIVALKACTTFQHYIFRGPIDVIQPYQHDDLPQEFLIELHKKWVKISETKEIHKGVMNKMI